MSAASQQERRREKRAQVQRTILDATETLLLEGVDSFSIRRLVERCGYTAPTIYHHFKDKEGLLDTLLDERFSRLGDKIRRIPQGDDPVSYLRAVALAFVRFGIRNPNHYQLLFVRDPDQAPPPTVDAARVQLETVWVELWDAGRLRTGDRESAAQSLWSLCHGLISGRIHRQDADWSKTLIEDSIDAMLRGLIAPPAKRTRRRKKDA
ncbi:MAG: hypothetical protein CL910_01270 [Deltaproteobacteria bacterium]|nr:hypothetical protein [Deltaproteobacteria bacterium]